MRVLVRALLSLAALLPLACSAAESPKAAVSTAAVGEIKEGVHYKRVGKVAPVLNPKRIDVAEFFWYGCPSCYKLDPFVEQWLKTKPADVDFARVPNTLGRPEGDLHSKMFYTADTLNIGAKMHPAIFNAMHGMSRLSLSTEADIQAFFTAQSGILPDVFTGTFRGFAVDSRKRRADDQARDYQLNSVPSIVVGGKYTTNVSMAGGFPQTVAVMEKLIEKVRQERK